jgi:hypothetical protein
MEELTSDNGRCSDHILKQELKDLSREQLENELIRSRGLLKEMGATYYAAATQSGMMGVRVPEHLMLPSKWLREAHLLMEGNTLSADSSMGIPDLEDMYAVYFEDGEGTPYIFAMDLETGETTLRAGEETAPEVPKALEVHIWMQASTLAAHRRRNRIKARLDPLPPTMWGLLSEIAAAFREQIKHPENPPSEVIIPLRLAEGAEMMTVGYRQLIQGVE